MAIEDAQLKVPATLGEAGPHVRTVATTIVGELEALARQLQPLQATWTGDAYDYYNLLQHEWNVSALGLFGDGSGAAGMLGDVAHRLDIAWYNYVTTQQANTKSWMH